VGEVIAAIYARKSTEDTRSKEEGKSTARQIEHATAYATKHGWAVDPDLIFIDENISGGEFINRPGLAACRAAASQHRFEKLIVMERSRLGRSTVRTLACVEELEEAGVEVHCYGEGRGVIRSSDVGTLVGAWSDTQELANASKRTREALVAKAQRGHATGPAPYGYCTIKMEKHSVYQIDPDEAAVVVQAFQWSAEGLGDDRVRDRLAELTGASWRKNSVRRMLANPIYVGRLEYGKTKTVPKGGRAKRRERRAEPVVRLEVPELRIVEAGLWAAVRARKEQTKAHYAKGDGMKPAAGTATKHMLTGLLRCGECGHSLAMVGSHKPRYFCLGRQHRGATFCSQKGTPMDALDKGVLKVLLDELLGDPERLYSIIKEREAARAVSAGPVVNVTREVAKLEREIANLVNLAASGDQDVLAGIKERRGRVELLKAKEEAAPAPVTKEALVKGYAALRMKINRKNPQEVRALLARLGCDRITVTKTGPNVWSFEGSFDAGRIVDAKAYPETPSLIETDARGYLLNIAPSAPA
jgi:DNA invertase Pin-like site-specific DNA recombinase